MFKNVLLLRIASTFIAVIFAISCNPQSNEIGLSFESIEQKIWPNSKSPYNNPEPGLIIISSPQEIVNVSDYASDPLMATLGKINYNDYFVIFAFQGRKPTSGYDVNIERITQAGKTISIVARFHEPKPDEAKADVVTSPYQVVQVNKSGGDWGKDININLVVDNTAVASLSHFIP